MSKNTEVETTTYKGFPVLAIWQLDPSTGQRKGKTPLISFGVRKAAAIMDHQIEIQKWLNAQRQPQKMPDPENMSDEDRRTLQTLLNKYK